MQLDARQLVIEAGPVGGEVDPATEAQDAMGMNAKDIVASWIQVCCRDELGLEVGCQPFPDGPPSQTNRWVGL